MAGHLQFKLYLHIGGKQEEVRRFSCDGNIDIGRLNVHIRETFAHLADKEFVLKWEDEEGDKVDITTQQELRLAMHEMSKTGSVYKLHVTLIENPWWKQVSLYYITWLGIKTNIKDQNTGSSRFREARSGASVMIIYPRRIMSQYKADINVPGV